MPDRRWLPPALIAGAYAFSCALYARLPERAADPLERGREVDGWSGRAVGAFLMPTVALGLWLLFLVLPRLDPRRANYARFGPTYDLIVAAVVVFQVALHVLLLGAALGWPIAVDTVIIVGVGLLLLLLGNVLPRVRPNWSGSVQGSTTADFAQDALAGVRFLKKHPRIAPDRVGLVGHSEGGIVAPLAASQSSDVAFIVLLAGTGVPGAEILHRQTGSSSAPVELRRTRSRPWSRSRGGRRRRCRPNGTPAGTRRLDLCPGPCSSRPVLDQVHAGRL